MQVTAPDPLPIVTAGQPYRCMLTATGGSGATVWSVASGKLPPGLTLAPGGLLSGVASTPFMGTLLFAVTDSSAPPQRATAYLDIVVAAGGGGKAVAITTASLPAGAIGSAYTAKMTAAGGQSPYAWSASGLPPGLTLTAPGLFAGTPSQAGSFKSTIIVTDKAGNRASAAFAIAIGGAAKPVIQAAYATGYEWLYDDEDSGAQLDVTAFRPIPPPGFGWLGHSLVQGYYTGFAGAPALTVQAIDPSATAPPIGFTEIWNDQGSRGTWSYTFWALIPPPGYVALGQLFRLRRPPRDYNPPSAAETDGLLCVRKDLVTAGAYGALIWLNTGCEADNSSSIFQVVNGPDGYETGGSAAVFYPGCGTASPTPPGTTPPFGVLARSSAVAFVPNPPR